MASSNSTRRVIAALHAHGLDAEVREMPGSTRTARDAAAAIGCEVAQIVKSLLFVGADGRAHLVLASGPNRVDAARLGDHLGGRAALADPATVRDVTGFAIGGVAPLGLASDVPVLMDEDLLRHDVVWAAAGTPSSVFPVSPDALRDATGATVLRVVHAG
jgi:prolyl-tRNA editing enzyme YbaK/EbsC (Cys-tRNA(Pro) deacylase)